MVAIQLSRLDGCMGVSASMDTAILIRCGKSNINHRQQLSPLPITITDNYHQYLSTV